ncbi:MAG: biotin--[acetyl-CoA-carboxylase] ligase [Gammaproteobacteria bacterium]
MNLPPVYEPVPLDRGSALREASRLAAKGADEGTLIWRGKTHASKDITDLDCALILRPEYSRDIAAQLIYVAAISLSSALAEAVRSLVELRFRWPNQVRVGIANTAFLHLQWPVSEARDAQWLVLGLRLKAALDAIADDTLFPDRRPTAEAILERFAKHFLADINRWAEEGFETPRNRWLSRADGIDEPIRLAIGDAILIGIFETIDAQGRLVVRLRDGFRQLVSIVEFFRARLLSSP